jgi:hypothetical protein
VRRRLGHDRTRESFRGSLASALGLPDDTVSVKATTADAMGFIGPKVRMGPFVSAPLEPRRRVGRALWAVMASGVESRFTFHLCVGPVPRQLTARRSLDRFWSAAYAVLERRFVRCQPNRKETPMLGMTETAIAALLKSKEEQRVDRLPYRPMAGRVASNDETCAGLRRPFLVRLAMALAAGFRRTGHSGGPTPAKQAAPQQSAQAVSEAP